ncbi:olfactory receptor 7A10-like [Talpa occidentalis]|uniref:olfactory receptor 7A10-like n=1 Tax=Talpa occidentalis TaxID=50954 RepID=UPI0023F6D079|nr:olfactory receptor 7A10-like [Talpa occidentalis]
MGRPVSGVDCCGQHLTLAAVKRVSSSLCSKQDTCLVSGVRGGARASELTSNLAPGNQTHATAFTLLGLSEEASLQPLLFGAFLAMYLVTVTGNLLIILAIVTDPRLHTPMYFFLANLSFADIGFTSTTVPKMLLNIQTQNKAITYAGCLSQTFYSLLFATVDNFLLTAMAYDRFVAICHPLHYMVTMNPQFCSLLLLASWVLSLLHSLLHSLMVLRLSFCSQLQIPHFFCELDQVIQLACSDTFLNELVVYLATGILGIIPLSGILFSYSKIVSSVLKISSASGRYKAFSTCGSHLSVVSLFYGTVFGVYLSSAATHDSRDSATASVMYAVVTPMLNPFIYSLRNKDIKQALVRLFSCRATPK